MHRVVLKALPLILVALGFAQTRRSKTGVGGFTPFALNAAVLMVLYPTRANDYSMPALLGFAPFVTAVSNERERRSSHLAKVVVYAYDLFIAIASFLTQLIGSFRATTVLCMVFSAIFLGGSYAVETG